MDLCTGHSNRFVNAKYVEVKAVTYVEFWLGCKFYVDAYVGTLSVGLLKLCLLIMSRGKLLWES